MAQIHMIGTAHKDPQGYNRLTRALALENPTIITVEANQTDIDQMRVGFPELRDKVFKLLGEKEFSEVGFTYFTEAYAPSTLFEYEASKDFANGGDIQVYLIDNIENAYKKAIELLFRVLEVIPLDCVGEMESELTALQAHKSDDDYNLCQRAYDGELSQEEIQEWISSLKALSLVGERDTFMANNIRELAKSTDGKLVHVGGGFHFVEDAEGITLYSKLKDLNPTRSTLASYDNFN